MFDLTTEFFWHCETAEHWSTTVPGSKGSTYTVSWSNNHKRSLDAQFDWSCTCMAYKTKAGYCKHIKQVIDQKLRCGWMQFTDGDYPKDDKCPRCGSGVNSMGWAV